MVKTWNLQHRWHGTKNFDPNLHVISQGQIKKNGSQYHFFFLYGPIQKQLPSRGDILFFLRKTIPTMFLKKWSTFYINYNSQVAENYIFTSHLWWYDRNFKHFIEWNSFSGERCDPWASSLFVWLLLLLLLWLLLFGLICLFNEIGSWNNIQCELTDFERWLSEIFIPESMKLR